MKRSRLKNINELVTRLMGALIYNERYMSLCGCFWKDYYINGRNKWLVTAANRFFGDKDHCRHAFIKSVHLQTAVKVFAKEYGD